MPATQSHKRVLVVDDEHIIADTIVAILRLNNYQASAAYSAEEALERCEGEGPDIVISDVVMGRMNGVQLVMWLAEHHPDCKVLLISGNAIASSLLADSRANSYIFEILDKPVHPHVMLKALASLAAL